MFTQRESREREKERERKRECVCVLSIENKVIEVIKLPGVIVRLRVETKDCWTQSGM